MSSTQHQDLDSQRYVEFYDTRVSPNLWIIYWVLILLTRLVKRPTTDFVIKVSKMA